MFCGILIKWLVGSTTGHFLMVLKSGDVKKVTKQIEKQSSNYNTLYPSQPPR